MATEAAHSDAVKHTPTELPFTGVESVSDVPGEIASLVRQCLNQFRVLVDIIESRELGIEDSTIIQDELSRFRMWAGNVAAHRSRGQRSLEHKLRDSSNLRIEVLRLLSELTDVLQQAELLASDEEARAQTETLRPSDETFAREQIDAQHLSAFDIPVDEATLGVNEWAVLLEEIKDIVTCLLRFSMALRRPAHHDPDKHASGRVARSFFPYDLIHVQSKFPKVPAYLAERLARGISRRRQHLDYRSKHHEKLVEGLDGDDDDIADRSTTNASSVERAHLSVMPALLGFGGRSQASETSFGSTASLSGQLRPPPRPELAKDGEPFECPLCYAIISVEDEKEWRRHVFDDLEPYVCPHGSCTHAEHRFSKRRDWVRHLDELHDRLWICPFGCPEKLATPQSLETHLRKAHAAETDDVSLRLLCSSSSVRNPSNAGLPCPLCEKVFPRGDQDRKPFGVAWPQHVGHHMEQLALFALPQSLRHVKADESEDSDSLRGSVKANTEPSDLKENVEVEMPMSNHTLRLDKESGTENDRDQTVIDSTSKVLESEATASTPEERIGNLVDRRPAAEHSSLHMRRTLDQVFYQNIDTHDKDTGQVVERYQRAQHEDDGRARRLSDSGKEDSHGDQPREDDVKKNAISVTSCLEEESDDTGQAQSTHKASKQNKPEEVQGFVRFAKTPGGVEESRIEQEILQVERERQTAQKWKTQGLSERERLDAALASILGDTAQQSSRSDQKLEQENTDSERRTSRRRGSVDRGIETSVPLWPSLIPERSREHQTTSKQKSKDSPDIVEVRPSTTKTSIAPREPPISKDVRFAQDLAVSRPWTTTEAWSLYHYETHARQCQSCYNPDSLYDLCDAGSGLMRDVRQHVDHRGGDKERLELPHGYTRSSRILDLMARESRLASRRVQRDRRSELRRSVADGTSAVVVENPHFEKDERKTMRRSLSTDEANDKDGRGKWDGVIIEPASSQSGRELSKTYRRATRASEEEEITAQGPEANPNKRGSLYEKDLERRKKDYRVEIREPQASERSGRRSTRYYE